jgi:hypothetical protein
MSSEAFAETSPDAVFVAFHEIKIIILLLYLTVRNVILEVYLTSDKSPTLLYQHISPAGDWAYLCCG